MLEWALFRALTVAIFILATAFFVAAEFALVSTRETRLEQLVALGRPGARTALGLKRRMDEFLPANQLGVTLASLALGWVGESSLAEILLRIFESVPFLAEHIHSTSASLYTHGTSVVLAFCLITYFEVLLGEQVPKALALQRGERIAIAVAGPMDFFIRMTRPAIWVMQGSAMFVLRVFQVTPQSEGGTLHSPEEIKLVATASRRGGLLPEFQEEIIHRALELNRVSVREVMTPRGRIFSLPSDMPIERASARVIEEQHSRVPVFDTLQGPEHIIGVLYAKDLARLMHFSASARRTGADSGLLLRQVMRDVVVVPETKPVSELLQEFKERRRQIAIAVDEFGSTVGLVTAEDLLEQVVGEMEDEFDVAARSFQPSSSGMYDLEGTVPLRDLTTQLNWIFPREAGIDTLAGFVLSRMGHIPQAGESFEYGDRLFTVTEVLGHRVSRIRVRQLEAAIPAHTLQESTD